MMDSVFHETADNSTNILLLLKAKYTAVHKKYIALPNTMRVSGDNGFVDIKNRWMTGDAPHKNDINKDVPRTDGSMFILDDDIILSCKS